MFQKLKTWIVNKLWLKIGLIPVEHDNIIINLASY